MPAGGIEVPGCVRVGLVDVVTMTWRSDILQGNVDLDMELSRDVN